MNKAERARKYNEALSELISQKSFYIKRIIRAREIVVSVWRKQYHSKLTLFQLMGIKELSILWKNKIDIHHISEESIKSGILKVSYDGTNGHTVDISSVLIYGSDRDIAKFARSLFTDAYRTLIWEDIGRMKSLLNPDSIAWLKRDIEQKQEKLGTIQEEYDALQGKYQNARRHRLYHGYR